MSVSRDITTSHDITTDAGFRAWAQAIHDTLVAVGLVQTSDTGQIDLTTVTTPGTNNTDAGYEIWRFNDAAQGSDPAFFRINYGRGAAAGRCRLQVVLGTGSNGSGTISGTTLTSAPSDLTRVEPKGAPGANGTIHAASGDGSRLVVSLHSKNSTPLDYTLGYGFAIERIRSLANNSLKGSAAICLVYWNGTGFVEHKSRDNTSVTYTADYQSVAGWVIPSEATTNIESPDTWVGLAFPSTKRAEAPLAALAVGHNSDFTGDDTGYITIGGTSRNYRVQAAAWPLRANSIRTRKLLLLNE